MRLPTECWLLSDDLSQPTTKYVQEQAAPLNLHSSDHEYYQQQALCVRTTTNTGDERPTSKMEPLLMCNIFINVWGRARRMAATCVYTRYMFVSRYFFKSKRGSKKVPQCPARPLHGKRFVPPEIQCTPEAGPPDFQHLCKYGCMKCINIIKSLPISI